MLTKVNEDTYLGDDGLNLSCDGLVDDRLNGGLGDVEALVNCIETAVLNGADIGKRTILFFGFCMLI